MQAESVKAHHVNGIVEDTRNYGGKRTVMNDIEFKNGSLSSVASGVGTTSELSPRRFLGVAGCLGSVVTSSAHAVGILKG